MQTIEKACSVRASLFTHLILSILAYLLKPYLKIKGLGTHVPQKYAAEAS